MGKITDEDLEDKLDAFAAGLGLHWYHHSEDFSGTIDSRHLPSPSLHEQLVASGAEYTRENLKELEKDFSALLEYLGVEIKDRVVVKAKKGKK